MTDPAVEVHWLVDTVAVAALPAEVDLLNAEEIAERLLSLIGEQPGMVVLDMTRTTFCDSAGAATLISAYKKAASAQVPLRLAASQVVARNLTLLAVDRLLSIYPTVEAAVDGGAPGPPPAPGHGAASPPPASGHGSSVPGPAASAADSGTVST